MQQRLFEITYLLTEHDTLTAGQLAERFGVSRRTIYRDIDALSAAGIPVYAEKGRGGGIRMLPDFVVDKTLFTEEEQRQLLAQADTLAGIDVPGSRQMAEKLAALFGRREDNWLEVDFAPWGGGDEMRALFTLLRDAIHARSVLEFYYTGTGGAASLRTAEPLKLLFRGQGWYLQAWCQERQDFRVFKLTRMHKVRCLEEHFAPKTPPPLAGDTYNSAESYPCKLLFAPEASFRVYDEFPGHSITPQPDGALLVDSLFATGDWMQGYLLSFGTALTILEPASLRDQIKGILQQTLGNYT